MIPWAAVGTAVGALVGAFFGRDALGDAKKQLARLEDENADLKAKYANACKLIDEVQKKIPPAKLTDITDRLREHGAV